MIILMEAASSSEMSVNIYHTIQHNIPENHLPHHYQNLPNVAVEQLAFLLQIQEILAHIRTFEWRIF
jgi:hypothetical protein